MVSSLLLTLPALAAAAAIEQRASCPNIHIFGARETTASPGYGSSITVVNEVLQAYPGSTAEAINYPACGGQSSCGGDSYAQSATQGTNTVVSVVNAYVAQCPNTQIVLVGYSQGAQIFDNAFCGGGDSGEGIPSSTQLNAASLAAIKAVILMGDPRYVYGLPYEVGTCRAGGFDARSASFQCAGGSKIQSYCDSADPYCCNGNDANVHQGYGSEYGQAALTFIKSKLSSGTTTTAPTTTSAAPTTLRTSATSPVSSAPATSPTGTCSALYGQCGGMGWQGPTCCAQGTCKASNAYYSQCL